MSAHSLPHFEHPYSFDPRYGHTPEQLLAVEPPRCFDGLEAFWRESYAQARAMETGWECRPSADETLQGHELYDVYDVSFLALGGRRIGGWLTVPRDTEPRCAVVVGHGYGGRAAPDLSPQALPSIRLYYCTRGFHRSAYDDLPDIASRHVVHGIESRESYILRGCAGDLWAAVGALQAYAPQLADRVFYTGSSFGGGIGALALPWEERLARVHIGQPTFGNHPFRVSVPCTGSGEAVRHHVQEHPEALEVLRYFDGAVTAQFFKVPMLVSCSLFDPAVPPPGQFAIYNAIQGVEKALFQEPAGHFEYEGVVAVKEALQERVTEFFEAGL